MKYVRRSDNVTRSFERRRCPGCGSGQYTRDVNQPSTMRKCESCGRVFHLEREGVRPSDKPASAPSSGEPIAGGAYAIAGRLEIRGVVYPGAGRVR